MPIPPLPPSWPINRVADPSWLAVADPDSLRAAVVTLSTRVTTLECQNAALEYAAESFGDLAERLNVALRALRETHPA